MALWGIIEVPPKAVKRERFTAVQRVQRTGSPAQANSMVGFMRTGGSGRWFALKMRSHSSIT